MTMPTRETVTRSYLPAGSDDLGELVTTRHAVGADGTEALELAWGRHGSRATLPADFLARHEEVGRDRLLAMRARHRTTHVTSATDETVPGDEGHEPPLAGVTNGSRHGGSLEVLFEREVVDGPLSRLLSGGGRPVVAYVPGSDAYVWANCPGGTMPEGLDIGELVPQALAGVGKVLHPGGRGGEETYLIVAVGEDVVTEDGTTRRVYPVLEGHPWREVEVPTAAPTP